MRFKFADAEGREISAPPLHDFISFVEGRSPADGEYLPINAGLWSDVARQINRVLSEQRQMREGHETMTKLLVLELFVLISRALHSQWEISVEAHGARVSEYMRSARRYIEENCGEELSLRQIAGYVYLSPSYFVRAFKEAWGQSPMHYLQQVRLAKAQEMLSGSDMSIRDVAQKAGFSDQRRMNELFMKTLGISPMKYRKQCGQG
jgi:transcriptional regulator GlxA family with amidase domain